MYQELVSKKEGVVTSTRVAQVTVEYGVKMGCEGVRDRVHRARGVTTLCRQRYGRYPRVDVVLLCCCAPGDELVVGTVCARGARGTHCRRAARRAFCVFAHSLAVIYFAVRTTVQRL